VNYFYTVLSVHTSFIHRKIGGAHASITKVVAPSMVYFINVTY
jgi:hypothetical protein